MNQPENQSPIFGIKNPRFGVMTPTGFKEITMDDKHPTMTDAERKAHIQRVIRDIGIAQVQEVQTDSRRRRLAKRLARTQGR